MIRNILITLLLSSLGIDVVSCHSGKEEHIKTAEEIKSQIDAVEFNKSALQYSEGKLLFSKYCNTCHYAPEENVLDQYTFVALFERLPPPAEDYFVRYISDSKAVKASGNLYAKQVDEVYKIAYEHHFKDSLTVRDFTNLITYIKIAAKQRYQNRGG